MASNSEQEDEINRTIWCGNVSNGKITEELLYELFLQAGPLEKVVIPKNGSCAFICYKHSASVPYAIDLFKTTSLFGTPLNIKPRSGSILANRLAGRDQSFGSADASRAEQQQSPAGGHYGGSRRYEPYSGDRPTAREDPYRSDSGGRWSNNGNQTPSQRPGSSYSDSRGRADIAGHGSTERGGGMQGGHHYQYRQLEGYGNRQHGTEQYGTEQHGQHDHHRHLPHDGSRGRPAWSNVEADRHEQPSSGPCEGRHDARGGGGSGADRGFRRPSAPPVAEASQWTGGNQSTSGGSLLGVPQDRPWESRGSGLLGEIPVGLLNAPLFVGDASQQFISFSNPPQGFYGPTPDEISTELRRQRIISSQSQQLAMRRK